jgi:hypothetical protein
MGIKSQVMMACIFIVVGTKLAGFLRAIAVENPPAAAGQSINHLKGWSLGRRCNHHKSIGDRSSEPNNIQMTI